MSSRMPMTVNVSALMVTSDGASARCTDTEGGHFAMPGVERLELCEDGDEDDGVELELDDGVGDDDDRGAVPLEELDVGEVPDAGGAVGEDTEEVENPVTRTIWPRARPVPKSCLR